MKTRFVDKNGKYVSVRAVEPLLNFTANDYEDKTKTFPEGFMEFFNFIDGIIKTTNENDGTFEDVVFIANDAFEQL